MLGLGRDRTQLNESLTDAKIESDLSDACLERMHANYSPGQGLPMLIDAYNNQVSENFFDTP